MDFACEISIAIFLDLILGDPKNFFHPVRLIGWFIDWLRKILFRENSLIMGLALCLLTTGTTGLFVWLALRLSGNNFFVRIYFLYSALAWRDLKDETERIFYALLNKKINDARKFLSYVVGRDTENLDETEITRAVIETISENAIDGVMSVIFFAFLGHVIFGSYGMILSVWIFKATSTLDSMVGYKKYKNFGMPSARLDDVLNFIPARLGGLSIAIVGTCRPCQGEGDRYSGGGVSYRYRALRIFLRDRLKHASPNSAHGESAFAGVLNIKLGGGAFYEKKFLPRPFINSGAREPEIFDIVRAWRLLDESCGAFTILIMALTMLKF